jgi:hypothetical protein
MKSATSKTVRIAAPIPKVELWRWFLWFGVIAIIIMSSLLKNEPVHLALKGEQDKLLHIIVFFGFLLYTKLLFKNLSLFKISLITFALGLLIELLQAWFTHGNRQFDAYDVLFNLLGIALGLLLLLVYRQNTNGNET